jgi:hypothetical protein
VVLATDTQYTQQYAAFGLKNHGPKLFVAAERQDLSVAIAGAGSVAFMKMAAADIKVALSTLTTPSGDDVERKIKSVLLDVYKTHIYPIPEDMRPDFRLIIGARTLDVHSDPSFDLWETTLTSLTPVTSYACIGVGNIVSDYAISLLHKIGSVEETIIAGAFCIKAAKDNVNGCGGPTHIRVIRQNAKIELIADREITQAEDYADQLFDLIKLMLEYLDPDVMNDEDVKDMVEAIQQSMMNFRIEKKGRREQMRQIRERVEARRAARTKQLS